MSASTCSCEAIIQSVLIGEISWPPRSENPDLGHPDSGAGTWVTASTRELTAFEPRDKVVFGREALLPTKEVAEAGPRVDHERVERFNILSGLAVMHELGT